MTWYGQEGLALLTGGTPLDDVVTSPPLHPYQTQGRAQGEEEQDQAQTCHQPESVPRQERSSRRGEVNSVRVETGLVSRDVGLEGEVSSEGQEEGVVLTPLRPLQPLRLPDRGGGGGGGGGGVPEGEEGSHAG